MVNYQYSVKFLLIKNSLIAAPATRLSVQFMQPAAKWTKWRCHKQRTEQTRTHTQAKHTYLHGTDKGKRLLQPELHGATRTFTNWLTQQPLLLSLRCSTLLFFSLSLSLPRELSMAGGSIADIKVHRAHYQFCQSCSTFFATFRLKGFNTYYVHVLVGLPPKCQRTATRQCGDAREDEDDLH